MDLGPPADGVSDEDMEGGTQFLPTELAQGGFEVVESCTAAAGKVGDAQELVSVLAGGSDRRYSNSALPLSRRHTSKAYPHASPAAYRT